VAVRNRDGKFRGTHQKAVISADTTRSRWAESEALRLKKLGMSDADIANQIVRIAKGEATPLEPLPPDVTFPENFTYSRQAVAKAVSRALPRIPNFEAGDFLKLTIERLEGAVLQSQVALQRREPGAVQYLVYVVSTQAKLLGMPKRKIEKPAGAETQSANLLNDDQTAEMLGRLTPDEQQDLLRLGRKARGDS
jgi:hypothetical protein